MEPVCPKFMYVVWDEYQENMNFIYLFIYFWIREYEFFALMFDAIYDLPRTRATIKAFDVSDSYFSSFFQSI